jgi:hypothetical protein
LNDLSTKIRILREAGYRYSFDRDLYLNPGKKKAFSVEFIEDRSLEEIANGIREDGASADWRFFFNKEPSEAAKRELSRLLNG